MSNLVALHQAGVRFGRVQALEACTLAVQRGERIALLGANGSGKSSLLRLLHGLIAPTAGQVQRDAGALQAFVFQRPFVLRTSVCQNVALAAWLQGCPWSQAKPRALQALAKVDLADLAQRKARTLSGGQQQRLAFARALVAQPELLFLDEPTASLAPQAKREVEQLMQDFGAQGGTLVFASHNLGQVKRLATRVIFLHQGRVLVDTSVKDFFNSALPHEAALFVQGEVG
jgi:tungstate transport system ATP-binding protein